MPWSLDWSLAVICAVLALYWFWMSRAVIRLERSVFALEDIVRRNQRGVSGPSIWNAREFCELAGTDQLSPQGDGFGE